MQRAIFVTLYVRFQRYGGPAEGGWWYHCNGPLATRRFRRIRKARKWVAHERARITRIIEEETFVDPDLLRRFSCDRPHHEFDPRRDRWPENDHGENKWLALERTPRENADTRRQHYE